ncbi:MAG: spondin domain-containing protein [Granulosicoccaceae bacterium]
MSMKSILPLSLLAALSSTASYAETVTVTIDNLTQGIHFTPLMVAAHASSADLFEVGTSASASLQMMAEGGSIDGLNTDLTAVGAAIVANPAGGLLAPANSATAVLSDVDLSATPSLSVVAMLLPTNDGFVGLDSIALTQGTHTYYANGYDAGTEANDERLVPGAGAPGQAGIPADPGGMAGSGGTGVAAATTSTVHIHPGALGDTNAAGGASDLDSRVHRWLNPVARITVEVSQ